MLFLSSSLLLWFVVQLEFIQIIRISIHRHWFKPMIVNLNSHANDPAECGCIKQIKFLKEFCIRISSGKYCAQIVAMAHLIPAFQSHAYKHFYMLWLWWLQQQLFGKSCYESILMILCTLMGEGPKRLVHYIQVLMGTLLFPLKHLTWVSYSNKWIETPFGSRFVVFPCCLLWTRFSHSGRCYVTSTGQTWDGYMRWQLNITNEYMGNCVSETGIKSRDT